MTPDFTKAFADRLSELVKDLRFYSPQHGAIAPRIYETMLPDAEEFVVGQAHKKGDVAPVICWAIDGGEAGMKDHPFTLSLISVLAVDPAAGDSLAQIKEGSAQIKELALALNRGLASGRVLAGCRLQLPLSFSLGVPGSEGQRKQPHPYYIAQHKLSFLMR